MDNVTHTLIGIAAAETLVTTRKKDKLALWIASGLANNLPDLDVIYAGTGRHGERLDYLLHHRGYTHTLLAAPLQSTLLLAILWLFWRKKADLPWREIIALSFLGPLLHLFADSWNSYGVHPFWPVDNHWYYGDIVFIIEPWLWAIFLPLVWKRAGSWWGKSVALLLLVALYGVCWQNPLVAWPAALTVLGLSLAWLLAQLWIVDDRKRLALSFFFTALLFGTFGWAELGLKNTFAHEGSEQAMLAHPANPFCWTVLTAGFQGDDYRARAWTAAPWPSIVSAAACPEPLGRNGYSQLQKFTDEAPSRYRISIGEFRGTRSDYLEVLRSCRARAFFRFARIPFWKKGNSGEWLVGDLRFDRSREPGFATLRAKAGDELCVSFEPPWIGRFLPSEI